MYSCTFVRAFAFALNQSTKRAARWLLAFAALPVAIMASGFNVTEFTDLPSGVWVTGFNDNNQITGEYTTGAPFIATTSSITVGSVSGLSGGVGEVDINDFGTIAGSGYTGSTDEAFIGNALVPLGSYSSSVASSLNNSGQLAGYVEKSNQYYAAIFTSSGTSVSSTAGTLFGSINNSGVATGNTLSDELIYGTTSSLTTVPLSAGFTTMYGYGINSAGHICGYGNNSNAGGDAEFFYYNGSGTTAIALPPGETSVGIEYNCINDSNQVVGQFYNSSSVPEGFVWDPVKGTQILNSLVPANWNIEDAYYINNNGAIVGYGTNGTYTGYVLLTAVAPEPSTFMLAAASLLALSLRRRVRKRVR